MKKLFGIIVLGILLALAYNYTRENKPLVKAKVHAILHELDEVSGDMKENVREKPDPMEEPAEDRTAENNHSGNATLHSNATLQHNPPSEELAEDNAAHRTTDKARTTNKKRMPSSANEKATSRWIKSITQRSSPKSWQILQYYDDLPQEVSAPSGDNRVMSSSKSVGTWHYVKYQSKLACLKSMGTNVHEIAHAFHHLKVYELAGQTNRILKWENARGYIYLSPTEGYLVSFPKEMLFPSREIAARIPLSRRTFRYDTYITGSNSTQSSGIFGLLNELQAYLHGSRFKYDVLEAYEEFYPQPGKGLMKWISNSQSSMAAFHEFHFFMQEYLLYMKETYPENFESLMSYAPFCQAYEAVYNRYHQLLLDYRQRISREVERLNESGKAEARIEDGVLWIQPQGSFKREGVNLVHEDVEKLQPVLESNRYKSLRAYLDFRPLSSFNVW